METPVTTKPVAINRWLPYWAVFQTDLQQVFRSWVYRFWLGLSIVATLGQLHFYLAKQHGAHIIQNASEVVSELLFWCVLGSVSFIIVLTGGSISSERGTMADSVLSRGISRYQYFLGKWHARLAAVLGTFLLVGLAALAGSAFLHEDLNLKGSLITLAAILALLTAVATCGVTVSAITRSTVLGIAILWIGMFGAGFCLSLLPASYPTPYQVLCRLPDMLRGQYDPRFLFKLIGWSLAASGVVALIGIGWFSRRDV